MIERNEGARLGVVSAMTTVDTKQTDRTPPGEQVYAPV
jgi:hypothetical protein